MPDQSPLRLSTRHLFGLLTPEQIQWFKGTLGRTGMRRRDLLQWCVAQAMLAKPPEERS